MRNGLEYFLFAATGLVLLYFVAWAKHVSFEHGWFSSATDSLGFDGVVIWFCLMMAIRPLFDKFK